jgi:hypothetical protein
MRGMPRRRDVWRIDRAGSLDRLTRQTEDLPDPAPGHARVGVRAVGLNFADIFACLGLYSATPQGTFIPGLEFAGIVEAMGPTSDTELRAIRVGDPVVGVTRFGGYATAINADLRYIRPIRAGWSLAEAAALPVQGLTAWYGLVRLGAVERRSVVLLQSAAGGVGLQALTILAATPLMRRGGRARIQPMADRLSRPAPDRASCVTGVGLAWIWTARSVPRWVRSDRDAVAGPFFSRPMIICSRRAGSWCATPRVLTSERA